MVRVQTQAMKIRAVCRRLLRDTRGVTLVVVALTLTALVGVSGLGVETGLWYMIKRYNQSAADIGALSGVMELAAGKSYGDICNLAALAGKANGFTFVPAACSAGCTSPPPEVNYCVNNPPKTPTSAYFNNANAVEVILTQQQNTFFASLFMPSVTIETRAVAAIENVSTCMIALSTSGPPDLDYKGGGHGSLTIPNCAFASRSSDCGKPNYSIDLRGNFDINAAAIATVGCYSIEGASGTVSPAIVTGAPVVADPYSSVTVVPPSSALPCINSVNGVPALTPGLGTRYGAITISAGNVNIPAGVYYLDGSCPGGGGLTISGGTVTGPGVTFVLTAQVGGTAGSVNITGGSGSLSAPTISGLLPPSAAASVGLLIFQDPTKSAVSGTNTIAAGCPGISLTGAIYTSLTQDTLQGNPTSCNACTELIAASFHLGGTPALDTSGCAAVGTKTASVSVIRLAE
jgi:Flp pilus assembly protein TadG